MEASMVEDEYKLYANDDDASVSDDGSMFESDADLGNFTYLDNSELSLEINKLSDKIDDNNPITIKLCIYKINMDGGIPFLQYLMDCNTAEAVTFPEFKYTIPTGEPDEHVYFINECLTQLIKIIPTGDLLPDALNHMYKGHLEYGDNAVIVFFNCTIIEEITLTTTISITAQLVWVIIDELVNTKQVFGKPMDPVMVGLFTENKYLRYLQDSRTNNIETPRIMYNCAAAAGGGGLLRSTYENTYYTPGAFNLLPPRINHPFLGMLFMFTTAPIVADNYANIKRYSVFTPNAKYILQSDVSQLPTDAKQAFIASIQNADILSFYFQENGAMLWGFKTINAFVELV